MHWISCEGEEGRGRELKGEVGKGDGSVEGGRKREKGWRREVHGEGEGKRKRKLERDTEAESTE